MTRPTAALTRRQRAAPDAYDRVHTRRGLSRGGRDVAEPRTLAVGLEDELARTPARIFDGLLRRDRWPWMHRETRSAVGNGWVNWTEAGPVRAELHTRNSTYRQEVGATASRFPYIPGSPTGGMHTMVTPAVKRTVQRYVASPQMVGARRDRLSPGRYNNQTYSQMTTLQGGARGRR